MSLAFLVHSLFLILGVILTHVWVNNPQLSLYTLQLIGLFILLYFIWVKTNKLAKNHRLNFIPSVILTLVVLLLVFSTGKLDSPLFFLVYFLLFGLSLSLDIYITVSFSICLALFLFFTSNGFSSNNLLALLSLVFITPLALFFGKLYVKTLHQKGEIKWLKSETRELNKQLDAEETNALLWLSLNFGQTMVSLIDLVSQALEKPLTKYQKDALEKALNKLKVLKKSGANLEKKIDEQTD